MPRLAPGVVLISQPVRTFPNGDFFYLELSRMHNRYDCILKMTCEGNARKSVNVVQAQGKTIREVEKECYEKALECCPRFPRPPYFKGASRSARVAAAFLAERFEQSAKT